MEEHIRIWDDTNEFDDFNNNDQERQALGPEDPGVRLDLHERQAEERRGHVCLCLCLCMCMCMCLWSSCGAE